MKNKTTQRLGSLATVFSVSLITSASAASLAVDFTGGATTSTLADFQVADPGLEAGTVVNTLDRDQYIAGQTAPISFGDFTIAPLGDIPTALANSNGASYTDGTAITDEYLFFRSDRAANDEGLFEIRGLAALAPDSAVTVTLWGIGDDLGQQTAFTATFGANSASGETVFTTGTDRGVDTGSVPFVQFDSFVTDGTTDAISIQLNQVAGGNVRYPINGFSVSVLPVPEPSSLMLAGLGAVAFLRRRR